MSPVLVPILCSTLLNAPAPEAKRPSESLKTATIVYAVAGTADIVSTVLWVLPGQHEANPLLRPLQDKPALMLTVGIASSAAGVWAWNKYVGRKHPKIAKIGLYAAAGVHAAMVWRNFDKHMDRQRVADSWKPRRGSFSIGYSASWK